MTSRKELRQWLEGIEDGASPESIVASLSNTLGLKDELAVLNHELRTPLVTVIGLSEVLMQDPGREDHEDLSRRIFMAARHCREVLEDLTEAGDSMEDPGVSVDAPLLVEKALDLWSPPPEITIKRTDDGQSAFVRGRPHRLCRVLLNLLRNAAEAMGNRGIVEITTRTTGDTVKIRVGDSGPGVPPEVQDRIFERNFTTKEREGGLGLGLHLCRKLVSSYGGDLSLEKDGQPGARFTVTLPRWDNETTTAPQSGAVPAQGLSILLIDDDPETLNTYSQILHLDGHRTECVQSGEEGLRRLESNAEFDVILCDVKIPDLPGPRLYERLREENPELASRVVFATGDIMSEDTRDFLDAIENPCLVKPFQIEDMRTAIRQTGTR